MKAKFFLIIFTSIVILFTVCSFHEFGQKEDTYTNLITYKVPGDLSSSDASEEELAQFAWQEFFALNWKASWTKDSMRTTPDTSWTLMNTGQPDIAVWETYIHRTELRPANGKRTKNLSKGKPYYTFKDSTIVNTGSDSIDLSSYWNVLDEDNEIGSAYLFSHEDKNEVLYMAKTNLKEYDYLKSNFPTDKKLFAANKKLSSQKSVKRLDHLEALKKSGMCASDSLTDKGYVCFPCGSVSGEGVIEIKLAFRKLDPSLDNIDRFITKEVVVFTKEQGADSIKAKVETYGLIGMHIIHKTENYPAFIFASWEQVDVRNSNMQTIGIDTVIVDGKKRPDEDPHRLNPVIERVIPETIQRVNGKVREAVLSQNTTSKWQYYDLIGVQATPLNYQDRNNDNNYFMANYVIESDLMLTNFHGAFGNPFEDSIQNVVYNGKSFNMGGCQGCHGQAQVNSGSDFSFLLGSELPSIKPDLLQTYEQAIKIAKTSLSAEEVDDLNDYIKD